MSAETLRKQIFVGCTQLGLDTDTRRDLQLVATGKDSLKDMTEAELKMVINALKKRGFKPRSKGRKPLAPRADLRKIHVLWKLYCEAGVAVRPGRDGLNAFIRERFGNKWQSVPIDVDALRDDKQINAVIQALKSMCRRAGVSVR